MNATDRLRTIERDDGITVIDEETGLSGEAAPYEEALEEIVIAFRSVTNVQATIDDLVDAAERGVLPTAHGTGTSSMERCSRPFGSSPPTPDTGLQQPRSRSPRSRRPSNGRAHGRQSGWTDPDRHSRPVVKDHEIERDAFRSGYLSSKPSKR